MVVRPWIEFLIQGKQLKCHDFRDIICYVIRDSRTLRVEVHFSFDVGCSYAAQCMTGCGGYLRRRASASDASQSKNRDPLPDTMTRQCRQTSQRLGGFWGGITDWTDEINAYGKVNDVLVESVCAEFPMGSNYILSRIQKWYS
jgi:hypothetical protein